MSIECYVSYDNDDSQEFLGSASNADQVEDLVKEALQGELTRDNETCLFSIHDIGDNGEMEHKYGE